MAETKKHRFASMFREIEEESEEDQECEIDNDEFLNPSYIPSFDNTESVLNRRQSIDDYIHLPSSNSPNVKDVVNLSHTKTTISTIKEVFHKKTKNERIPEKSFHIKVKGNKKNDYSNLIVTQKLAFHQGPIWIAKFSLDGKYLATGGKDCKLVIWRVKGVQDNFMEQYDTSQVDKVTHAYISANENNAGVPACTGLDIINSMPLRCYTEHVGDIVDLSWSRNHFVLTASLDKFVKLWHVGRENCLQSFAHDDMVTSVSFHPTNSKLFLSGCFDSKIRLWEMIPEGTVKSWVPATDVVTAVCFSPDGDLAVAGLFNGQVFFYKTDGMKYYTQLDCVTTNADGVIRKVTNLCFLSSPSSFRMEKKDENYYSDDKDKNVLMSDGGSNSDIGVSATHRNSLVSSSKSFSNHKLLLLVSTNDSRSRIFRMKDFGCVCKFKGILNSSMQIRSSVSSDNSHVICGSENGNIGVWAIPHNVHDSEEELTLFSQMFFTKKKNSQKPDVVMKYSYSEYALRYHALSHTRCTNIAQYVPLNTLKLLSSYHASQLVNEFQYHEDSGDDNSVDEKMAFQKDKGPLLFSDICDPAVGMILCSGIDGVISILANIST